MHPWVFSCGQVVKLDEVFSQASGLVLALECMRCDLAEAREWWIVL
jgi:hypothetical protein